MEYEFKIRGNESRFQAELAGGGGYSDNGLRPRQQLASDNISAEITDRNSVGSQGSDRSDHLDLVSKKGTKTEANHRLNEVLEQYNNEEQCLHEGMTRADKERSRSANLRVENYLTEWLESSEQKTPWW